MFVSKNLYHTINVKRVFNQVRVYSQTVNPFVRTWKLISREVPEFLGINQKAPIYPEHADIVIIGGGYIGAATAYWLKTRAAHGLSIVVIEKDLTYKQSQGWFSQGMLVQNFSLPENIALSKYSAEFLRKAKDNLGANIDIQYRPNGYLVLASEHYAEKLEQTATQQRELGIKNELLSADEIKRRYPWINTTDIKIGCTGLESEGVFNSWSLHKGLIQKSQELGTIYMNAEVVGFQLEQQRDVLMEGVAPGTFERINKVVYRTPDNQEYSIKFAACILAAGDKSGQVAKLAKVGIGDGLLAVPLPIEQRNITVYSIEDDAARTTGLKTPVIMDTSGLWLRRNNLENSLLCGHIPFTTEETKNLTEDEYYDSVIQPSLNNRFPHTKGKQRSPSLPRRPYPGGRNIIRQALINRGVPSDSLDILMASFADNTISQYNSSLKGWWEFCEMRNYSYFNASVSQLIEYLTQRFQLGAGYSTLNTTRSALALILDAKITSHDCVSRFLKGVFKLKPPTPKYEYTWDPNIVLTYLSNCYPYENVSLRDLSLKTVTLLSIASAQRMQTLSVINIKNIFMNDEYILIKIDNLIKTSRPGAYQPLVKLPFIKENPRICPALALEEYLKKTKDLRSDSDTNLFISYRKPHKRVGTQTLAHWVKFTLQRSGIDTSIFSAHSTRHASTSAARRAGVSLEAVRKAAGWSNTSNVFVKYYNKDIMLCQNNNDFIDSIFNSN